MKFLIVIPAYNEESIIESTLKQVDSFLAPKYSPDQYQIIVADNGSTDNTVNIVNKLSCQPQRGPFGVVSCLRVPQKGKGLAIKTAWEANLGHYDLLIFMDADLATDLEALSRMLALAQNHDLIIGDRYHPGSYRERTIKRSIFSRLYRLLCQLLLRTKISDYPCGFKAIKSDSAKILLPLVKNNTWFFDSELVYLAQKKGYKIVQIPVRWIDRLDRSKSKVNVLRVSAQYLRELLRLARSK